MNCIYLRFIALIAGMLLLHTVQGQTHHLQCTHLKAFDWLTNKHGLSQGMVTCFLRDRQGFLWVGTKDGLNRYDGYEIKVKRRIEGSTATLSDNYITSLFEDEAGMIWIGTMHNGITRYDPQTDRFLSNEYSAEISKQLTSLSIRSFEQDKHGRLWVATAIGFDYFNPTQLNSEGVSEFKSLSCQGVYVPKDVFNVVKWGLDEQSDLILFYKGEKLTYRFGAKGIESTERQSFRNSCAFRADSSLYPVFDESGRMRMVLSESGISCLDPSSGKIISSIAVEIDLQNFPPPVLVNDHDVWIRTEHGLCCYSLLTHRLCNIGAKRSDLGSNIMQSVYSSYIDPSGIVWLGTFAYGFLKFTPDSERFGHIKSFNGRAMSVNGIFESPDQRIIVTAFQTADPIILDLEHANFSESFSQCSQREGGLRNGNSIVFDSAYAYLSHKYLYRLDLQNESASRLEQAATTSVIYDPLLRVGSGLWAANGFPAGRKEVLQLDPENGQIQRRFAFPVPSFHHEYRFVSEWLVDHSGTFWFATLHGVHAFDPSSEEWRSFSLMTKGRSNDDEISEVFAIQFDASQPELYLWVGTNGFGLKRLNMKSGSVQSFTTVDGLSSDVIYGIETDARGNLWMSTNRGICQFIARSQTFHAFTLSDGLQEMEFNRYAHLKLSDGRLLFGGVNGINVFDPEDFYSDEGHAAVSLTNLKFNNALIEPGDNIEGNVVLEAPIGQLDQLTLPVQLPMISFSFAYFDLHSPHENEFMYKLEGFNDDWIKAGTSHEATYTNLDPGSYTFRVKGRRSSGEWSPIEASLSILVPPPYWATWWFRILALLTVLVMVYVGYHYRVKQLLRIERLRNRIAQDLHDDIGSTLSSITLYSHVLQRESQGLSKKSSEVLQKISTNSTAIMESMNDIVWAINADNDSFEEVINRMRSFAVSLCEAQDIALRFNVDKSSHHQKLSMIHRRNIYLIFKEAVNNAVKYSHAELIHIEVSHHQGRLNIAIEDNGRGFDNHSDYNKNTLSGNGLQNLKKRANDLNAQLQIASQPGEGTTISLIVPV